MKIKPSGGKQPDYTKVGAQRRKRLELGTRNKSIIVITVCERSLHSNYCSSPSTRHPFVPSSSQGRDDHSYFTDESTEAQISDLASGRLSVPTWPCQKSWWAFGRPRLGSAEPPSRTFSERSLQKGPCRPSPHHLGDFQPGPGWLGEWGHGLAAGA